MKIKWEVEDGYVGKSRPQYLEIPDEDLEDMDEDEKQSYIEDSVKNDFENKVSFTWEIID